MKSVIIADIHWGVRNDNQWFLEKQVDFFQNRLCPYIAENQIDNVFILGDWFDRRKFINYKTLNKASYYLQMMANLVGNKVYMLVGNHDTYYKSTNDLNSVSELYKGVDKVQIIDKPTVLEFGEKNPKSFLFVPWIYPAVNDEWAETILHSDADYCCGHFELKGAKMNVAGITCQHGFGTATFDHFDHVFTGHFHRPSKHGNVTYIGSPIQYSWNDYSDEKRFAVLDHETGDFDFCLTNDHIFVKIYYNNGDIRVIPEVNSFNGKNIKMVVESKNNLFDFDKFIEKIESEEPYKIDIIEQHLYQTTEDDDQKLMDKDTLSIIMESVDEMDITKKEKYNVKLHINSIHAEAIGAKY